MSGNNKIIRSISYFTSNPNNKTVQELVRLRGMFSAKKFTVQTIRLCTKDFGFKDIEERIKDDTITLGLGSIEYQKALSDLRDFYSTKNVFFNFKFDQEKIERKHVDFLFRLVKEKPEKTFNFTFDFNTPSSSAFYPSARYEKEGFSIGLQPTDLADGCNKLDQWLFNMKSIWGEIIEIVKSEDRFLGIDSSVAPLFEGKSSLINFIKKINGSFSDSVTSDVYTKITEFIKKENPKPIGLCGLMFPCLEDFELAEEYQKGNFTIERNLFLSLHSGLGIDTYPIGVDEKPERVLQILQLVQALAVKHNKALSSRFVSDGKAKVGDKTDFKNQYLKDVVIRKL